MSEPPTTPPPFTPPPPSPPPSPPPPAAPPPTPPPASGGSGDTRNLMLVLAYLGPFAIIPLLAEKDDREVQWHAKHGLVLFGAVVAISIALAVVSFVLNFIPVVGQVVGVCLGCIVPLVLGIGYLVVIVMGIVKATKGERFLIPGVSEFADKF
ncbi:MAG TPA: hypothetical protein VMT16_02600 [Thermoanaerobaculia bacterium]|nr:hypothetical protein [Thermoanaerobaculia bacterium]